MLQRLQGEKGQVMKISEEGFRELPGWSEQLLYYWNIRGALAAGESDGGGRWGQRGLREGRLVRQAL